MMTIWFLAKDHTYIDLAAQWGTSFVDKRDLYVREIASMRDRFIVWPQGPDFDESCHQFSTLVRRRLLRGFSRCVGAIDGTYIKIMRPTAYTLDQGTSHNSGAKRFHAIQCLAVAAANYTFTYVYCGEPGSRADIHMLRKSRLYQQINWYIPPDSGAYLLGDAGFRPCLPWLLIPFLASAYRTINPLRKQMIGRYDAAQCSARVVIEQAFGILKGRWRCLRNGLRVHLPHTTDMVIACMVLHNICILRDDVWSPDDADEAEYNDEDLGLHRPAWLDEDNDDAHPHGPYPNPEPTNSEREKSKVLGEKKREAVMKEISPELAALWETERAEAQARAAAARAERRS